MAKGLAAERLVARDLQRHGYMVSSRRHFGGAGDILAVAPFDEDLCHNTVLLVEVKATGRGPFANFSPADRNAMRLAHATHWVGEVLLAWVQGERIFYIPAEEWPP